MNKIKRIFATILCIYILSGTIAYADVTSTVVEREYELWTQSPTVTSGLTAAEAKIYKALEKDVIDLYPLTDIGDNYYLAICEYRRTNGGSSGSVKTSLFYLYTLYETEDSFIVLSQESTSNECYWDYGFCLASVLNKIDVEYYRNNNSEVPYYIFTTNGKYSSSGTTDYSEYWFISESGTIYTLRGTNDKGEGPYPYIKDGVMYKGQEYYLNKSSLYQYYMSDNKTPASNSCPLYFRNKALYYGTSERVAVTEMETGTGYTLYKGSFGSSVDVSSYYSVPNSDNFYYSTSVQIKNNYKYLKINVYKYANGKMTLYKSKSFPTQIPSTNTFTYQCKKITGLTESYYTNSNELIPSVLVGNYAVITRDGQICELSLNKSKYKTQVYFGTYNGKFVVVRSYDGDSLLWMNTGSGNKYHQAINEISFNENGEISLSEDVYLIITGNKQSGQNGYFSYYDTWVAPDFTEITDNAVKNWWNKTIDNVFPDGRYVEVVLKKVTGTTYEVWYQIFNPDKSMRAEGPTGYSTTVSSALEMTDLVVWAINDSKFVFSVNEINNDVLKEYYRVAVVEETDTGEVVSKVEIGEKNIIPPNDSDTEIIQSKINFGLTELPIGYNIKNNVIDSEKLDAMLRDQVNSIRLNDIVILAKEGYQSGEQNTGITLNSYSEYDYTLGAASVYMYTNGQYFRWYCNNPEDLMPGIYSKEISVGDKTLYVTFKVIKPPTNEGSTTVVF